jgi:hypothetical protein
MRRCSWPVATFAVLEDNVGVPGAVPFDEGRLPEAS